jgi:hypothetical protein
MNKMHGILGPRLSGYIESAQKDIEYESAQKRHRIYGKHKISA